MATRAISADAGRASSEFDDDYAIPTRRKVIGLAAIALVAATVPSGAGAAAQNWVAADWINRWHKLGCGLDVGGNALNLKGRLNGDRAAIGAMMAEIASPERQTAVIERVEACKAMWSPREDPALRAVREMEAIDAEFISLDDDPEGNAAWLERWDRAFDRLPSSPATTPQGRAAKLRYAIEYVDTPRGDKLMQQVMRHLETEA